MLRLMMLSLILLPYIVLRDILIMPTLKQNVLGAENVTAFAEKYGIKKIVFTSSIAPYGAAEELKEETTVPNS